MLPSELTKHRPEPLSQTIADLAKTETDPGNVHALADRLAVESTPVADLPSWLRTEAKRKEKAQAEIEEADRATNAKLQAWTNYQSALSAAGEIRQDINAAQEILERCKAPTSKIFTDWVPSRRLSVFLANAQNQILEAVFTERMALGLPETIKALKSRLAEAEAQIADAERTYGFGKE